MMKIALAGNPNSGKTTLFNTLTGSRHHVGNWPGKTVEKKDGKIKYNGKEISIVDLPGTYSLTAFSAEEVITRDFIMKEKPDVVINILDATNLQRNLYLTLELMELGAPMVLMLNMDKFAGKKGILIDEKKISDFLKVPVIKAEATKKEDVNKVIGTCLDFLKSRKEIRKLDYGEEIEPHLEELSALLAGYANKGERPRWMAIKLLENDTELIERIKETHGNRAIQKVNRIKDHLKGIFGSSFDSIISDRRYGIAAGIVKESVRNIMPDRISRSDKIDRIVTNRWIGIPIFLVVMFLLFQLTFTLAAPFVKYIDMLIGWVSNHASGILAGTDAPQWAVSFIIKGVIGGVGTILVFLPNIFVLFFIISILEDSGYLARAAFIMDEFMHRLGLHGKSFIPLILGFGCNVPAIMSCRSLDNDKDRILTILINPFMSCSARLPVYILFVGAFFAKYQGLVLFSLYMLGIGIAVISGMLFKRLFFKGESSELIMELPPYRIPTLKGALIHMWERGRAFLYKAGTLIFCFVIVIWFLSNLPLGVAYASENSFIGIIGKVIAPALKPLGFGNWQSAVALLFGIAAKEVVVSTFGTLYGVSQGALAGVLQKVFTPLSAYAFMVMTLIYIPCIATIAVIKKETGSWKWPLFSVIYSLTIGWIAAFIVYQGGLILGFV